MKARYWWSGLAAMVVASTGACGGPESYPHAVGAAGRAGGASSGKVSDAGLGAEGGMGGIVATGFAGTSGAAGTIGVAGATGAAGTTGVAGATGAAGTAGAAGTSGAAGATGAAGTTGSAGTTGTAGTAGTAGTGGTGRAGATGMAGSTGTGGPTASGSAGTTGAGGGGGTGVTPTGACANKTRKLGLTEGFLANFENGNLAGWYDYRDPTATATLNHVATGTPGAASTVAAGHLSGTGFTGFGAGMGLGLGCFDVSVFDGISFWAKGKAGTTNVIAMQVAIPETHAVANGGDCVSKCFDHPQKTVTLGSTWQHYTVTWSQLAQAGFGNPATFKGMIMALNWVSIAGPDLDFWVDEIALYKGSAPSGPVGP